MMGGADKGGFVSDWQVGSGLNGLKQVGQFRPVPDPGLVEDIFQVGLDGKTADKQSFTDLVVSEALTDPLDYFNLPPGELVAVSQYLIFAFGEFRGIQQIDYKPAAGYVLNKVLHQGGNNLEFFIPLSIQTPLTTEKGLVALFKTLFQGQTVLEDFAGKGRPAGASWRCIDLSGGGRQSGAEIHSRRVQIDGAKLIVQNHNPIDRKMIDAPAEKVSGLVHLGKLADILQGGGEIRGQDTALSHLSDREIDVFPGPEKTYQSENFGIATQGDGELIMDILGPIEFIIDFAFEPSSEGQDVVDFADGNF